ncbi:hypothetical protein IWX64_001845, partial [Arthrobacter sp. CAN_A212]
SAVLTGNRFPNLALKESVGKVAVSHPMLTDRVFGWKGRYFSKVSTVAS